MVWVNGRLLGRHWFIGPQQTLYLPGVWLRGDGASNTIQVLELYDPPADAAAVLQATPVLG